MTSQNDPKDQHPGLLIFDVDSKYDVAMLTLLHTTILHIRILRQPERKESLNSSSLFSLCFLSSVDHTLLRQLCLRLPQRKTQSMILSS